MVIYTAEAYDDLDEILFYGADRFGIAAAVVYDSEIRKRIDQIEEQPLMGLDVGDGLRRIVFGPYLIFYSQIEGDIIIAGIERGERDISRRF